MVGVAEGGKRVNKIQFGISIDPDDLDKIKRAAVGTGQTVSGIFVAGGLALVEHLEAENGGPFKPLPGPIRTGRPLKRPDED